MTVKLASLLLAAAVSLTAMQAAAADKVTLQLKWVTQAQFAGYYVAKDKGFYEEKAWTSKSSRAALISHLRRFWPVAAPT